MALAALFFLTPASVAVAKDPSVKLRELEEAVARPIAERRELEKGLLEDFRKAASEEERVKAAFLLGLHRCATAVDDLSQSITFRTEIVNENHLGYWSRYPAADALVKIGQPSIPAMLTNIRKNADERTM
jgi:hypothetical protein